MNRIYKVIWSKAKNCYVVVSELAHTHTKTKASLQKKPSSVLTAAVLASLLATGVPGLPMAHAEQNPKADTNYVVYDDSDATTVTLEDNSGEGTKVTNVKAGDLAAASKDAVNGSQLYETNRNVASLNRTLSQINNVAAQAQTDITRIKTQNLKLESQLNTVDTEVTTGWNATIDGAKVKTINPADNSLNFSVGKDISLTDPGNGSILVSVDSSKGTIAAGNTNVVNGGTVYTALNAEQTAREAADTTITNKIGTLDANGNYIQKDASVSSNLNTLDTQVKANADAVS
ncbi:ESPR-type extended signal peptide-containing protein, partial [Mitsuokella jalaludinii]|uniref:ESPR domain-containing protein n=1 Tax=Mitsuokella jalaludinii TaxID=187979 RepID=UPI003F8B4077